MDGAEFEVKDSFGYFVGPGPNLFSASEQNVSFDRQGNLHLKVVEGSGPSTSSEIMRTEAAGFGVYECRLSSRLDNLDSNVVAACFVYESQNREIDFIECSPGLVPSPNKCQYVVQPYTTPGNLFRFDMPSCPTSTHRMVWTAGRIEFMSWCGHDAYPPAPSDVVAQWTYQGGDIPPAEGRERARVNMWQVGGKVPAGDGGTELVLT